MGDHFRGFSAHHAHCGRTLAKVRMRVRLRCQPGFDLGVIVGRVVVGNAVDVELGGHSPFDLLQKRQIFLRSSTSGAPRSGFSGGAIHMNQGLTRGFRHSLVVATM